MNVERIKFTGDASAVFDGAAVSFYTSSMYDNAFISHTIPRTDQQTRWITASII